MFKSIDVQLIARRALALLVLIYALTTLPYLTTFPPVDNVGDESWMINIAWNILDHGTPVASMHVGTPVAESPSIVTTWIYSGILAGTIGLFGHSVESGRMISFLCGLLVMLMLYKFGREVGGRKTGLLSTLFLSTCIAFSWHSREARPEMMLLLFLTVTIYTFYRATIEPEQSVKWLFVSGLVATLSVQVHPNGAIYAISILMLYPVYLWDRIFTRSTLALLGGLGSGLLIWVIFNYIPYSNAAFETVHSKYLPPFMTLEFMHFLERLAVYTFGSIGLGNFKFMAAKYHSELPHWLVYISYSVVIASLIFTKRRKCIMFLISFLVIPLVLAHSISGQWNFFHNSAFLSMFFLTLAFAVVSLAELPRKEWQGLAIIGVVAIAFMSIGTWDIMSRNLHMSQYNYKELTSEINEHIPEGATVMGSSHFYFAFMDDPDRFSTFLFLENSCPDFHRSIHMQNPDYLLIDSTFVKLANLWCSPSMGTDYYFENVVRKFLADDATFVKTVQFNYPNEHASSRMLEGALIYKIKKIDGKIAWGSGDWSSHPPYSSDLAGAEL
ncbi:ArnT family glycosyltransferase [Nitrospirota bacterium]